MKNQIPELDDNFFSDMAALFPWSSSCCTAHSFTAPPLSADEYITEVCPNENKARNNLIKALSDSCGKPWQGIEQETPLRRNTLIILAAYTVGYPVENDLRQMVSCMSEGKELPEPDKAILNAALPVLARAGDAHAFSNTVALSVIGSAKQSNGVLPSSWFLYLGQRDRIMWLLLNGYGRNKCFAETLGIVSHHYAECLMKRPLTETFMIPAVNSLQESQER